MQLPARIGKYELLEFLGGGMSHVYRSRDTVIGRIVAVKILTEAGCADPDAKARFLAEARMAGNISHDNVLSIYDFGEDEQHRPFMVMEFLRGETLRQAIQSGHTGDMKSKLAIALGVARALQYIHTQKIIHRDIKPENVHVSTAGVVKLMDFGIAKSEGLAMTRAGYVLGTPYYMAPEQVMGHQVTEQVDVYAFGVLLFELTTGAKPITGDTVERIFYSILHDPLNLEPMHQAGVPQALCDLVQICTAKNPLERPHGFGPVCAELERVAAGLDAATVVLERPAPPAPARPAWLMPVVIVAALAVLVGLIFALRPSAPSSAEQKPPASPITITTPTGEMVLVPAGVFRSGEHREPVSLPAFYIDKTEVSNRAYAAFSEALNRPLPKDFPPDKPDLAVVNISIVDAKAFATWADKRLPTAREWEKAARGTDGRLFPWGNEKDVTRANVGNEHGGIRPVTDYPGGASPYGALNMVGNVWEFVEELTSPSQQTLEFFHNIHHYDPSPDELWYTIRGLSYAEDLSDRATWDAGKIPASWREQRIGFRCAKDAP